MGKKSTKIASMSDLLACIVVQYTRILHNIQHELEAESSGCCIKDISQQQVVCNLLLGGTLPSFFDNCVGKDFQIQNVLSNAQEDQAFPLAATTKYYKYCMHHTQGNIYISTLISFYSQFAHITYCKTLQHVWSCNMYGIGA